MYVAQILSTWLLLEAFTPTTLTQRHTQRRGHRKSDFYGEPTENEDIRSELVPSGGVDYMQKYAGQFEGKNRHMSSLVDEDINQPVVRALQSAQARMPFDKGFYRRRYARPSRARMAHTFTNADYYNPINGRHSNENPRVSFTRNDHINSHNHLQSYRDLYPPRAGGYYQQNAAPYFRRLQPTMPNRNMLGALPYYNRHYRQPLAGLHQSMPTSEEQHTRTDAEPSEGAFGEITDSKEDEEEDMRKHGRPNARGFPNGNMLEEQPYNNLKYEKYSEVMHPYMPLTGVESLKNNEEESEEEPEEDQAFEEGENESMRKGARRYTEDIPYPNTLEEMSLHGLNSKNLRSGEVSEEQQDSKGEKNTNEEVFLFSKMADELHHYKGYYGKTSQADQQNIKNTGDETAPLGGVTTSQADQQNTKTTKDRKASLESTKTFQADLQNTKTTGDETASLEGAKPSQADQQNIKTLEDEASSKRASTTQADQQNTKIMGGETVSLKGAKSSQADQQNTKTTGNETALEGAKTSQADQQNTKATGDETASLESVVSSQADQQNTKITRDEAASLASVKTFQADQQNTKTTEDRTASLESTNTSPTDQQNTKTTGDETASLESTTPSIADSSTAEATPSEVTQSTTTTTEVKHIQNETESTTTTKNSRSTAQTTPSSHEKTKNIELTSTQNGTDFLNDVRGLEDRSNATVSVE